MEVKPAEFIRLDLFPAAIGEVTDIESLYHFDNGDSRVIVTNDMFYIFKEGSSGGPEIVYSNWLEDFQGNNREGYYVVTANDGPTFYVSRSKGCGCGSTLRGFFPFPGVPFRFE